nr:hypothetical protein [Streptomyces sp. TLI_235]
MSADPGDRPKPKPIDECRDVYDVLEHVRLRPAMFVRNGSLEELMTLLNGYGIALHVHGIDEHSGLSPVGPFAQWLRGNHGWSMSCGWARAITDHAEDVPSLEAFFRLLDEWRASTAAEQTAAAGS